MSKKYFIKDEVTEKELEKMGFLNYRGYGFVVRMVLDDHSMDLYINTGGSSTYELRRIMHNENSNMVKKAEIKDMIAAGMIRS